MRDKAKGAFDNLYRRCLLDQAQFRDERENKAEIISCSNSEVVQIYKSAMINKSATHDTAYPERNLSWSPMLDATRCRMGAMNIQFCHS